VRVRETSLNTVSTHQHPPHLANGEQQAAVGVEDDAEGQRQAEQEQAQDVGHVVGRLRAPVHRAGGPGALGAVAAPAQQRRHGPRHGVEPGEADAQQGGGVAPGVGHGGAEYGAVTLVGQHRQRDQGHDAWVEEEMENIEVVEEMERWRRRRRWKGRR